MVSRCPHCGEKLKGKNNLADKIVVCPACKHRFKFEKIRQGETAQTTDLKNQSRAMDETAAHKPTSRIGVVEFVSDTDQQSVSGNNTSSEETEQDAALVGQGRPSNSVSRKKLFTLAVIVALFAGAVVILVVKYLYPKSQGPLTVYVVPHVDDIDGSIDKNWFSFFDQLRRWHDRYLIPACFAFYPETMNDEQFNRIIADMYDSKNIELVLKGEDQYQGKRLDQMSLAEVGQAMNNWKDKFVFELQNLGYSDIKPPVTYNQLMMRLNETIRDAVHDAQFKVCLELGGSEHGYINMLPDFDITQYSVSLTKSGEAGPNEEFKTTNEVVQELINYQSDYLIYINSIKVVPLVCSQQDFRVSEESPGIDEGKWKAYTSLLRKADKDTRICLLTARDVYELRHIVEIH